MSSRARVAHDVASPQRLTSLIIDCITLSAMTSRFLYTSSHSLLRSQLQPLTSSAISHRCRGLSTAAASPSKAAAPSFPSRPLTAKEREFLERAVSNDVHSFDLHPPPIGTDRTTLPSYVSTKRANWAQTSSTKANMPCSSLTHACGP